MPRIRRGPGGPKRALAGKKGTNKATPKGGAGSSGLGHEKQMTTQTKGSYPAGRS